MKLQKEGRIAYLISLRKKGRYQHTFLLSITNILFIRDYSASYKPVKASGVIPLKLAAGTTSPATTFSKDSVTFVTVSSCI